MKNKTGVEKIFNCKFCESIGSADSRSRPFPAGSAIHHPRERGFIFEIHRETRLGGTPDDERNKENEQKYEKRKTTKKNYTKKKNRK